MTNLKSLKQVMMSS